MRKGDYSDYAAFIAVAEEGSFTRAAARFGLSQSALSYSVRMLEQRLDTRLIARTTRSLSLTDAGETLLRGLRPAFEHIDNEIAALRALNGKPFGTIRLTTFRRAATSILRPAIARILSEYPDISFEINLDEGLVDIVKSRFDAGVRLGEQVQKDMISIPVGPDLRMAVVGSPSYFASRDMPRHPRDLSNHACATHRRITAGGIMPWEFDRQGIALEVRVDGPLIYNDGELLEHAALDGVALAYLLEEQVADHLASGRLIRVLDDWCEPFPGYHLYYPSRRQHTAAFAVLIDELRYSV